MCQLMGSFQVQLPKGLGTLYDATLQLASYEDVLSYCASLDVSVSAEQVRFVLVRQSSRP